MRTEFLVLGRATMPDEDEQYRAYKRVVEAFEGKPVVIRTFDIGGDKLPIGGFPSEPNPFLGWRAIRMCLDQPDLFRTQLRALLRAAEHGDVRIMLPLVVTLDEVRGLVRLATSDGQDAHAEARSLAVAHVAEIRAKIADLQAMERVLTDAICECEAGRETRCPLIEVISGNDS